MDHALRYNAMVTNTCNIILVKRRSLLSNPPDLFQINPDLIRSTWIEEGSNLYDKRFDWGE
jgi:hypothetical protein